MTNNIKNYLPFLLPLLLIFSRSLADITIVLIGLLFLYHSFKNIGWEWVKEKWFCFALIFWFYCIFINSPMSINPLESLLYSVFFIRWPIFAIALSYWILNDTKSLKKFIFALILVLGFIIFDTWWQFIYEKDLFGFERFPYGNPLDNTDSFRLTGPFKNKPLVGAWLAKLALLPPLLLIINEKIQLKPHQNNLTYLYFIIIPIILFFSIMITGERMALLLILSSIVIFFTGLILDKKFSIKKIFIFSMLTIFLIFILIFSYSFPDTAKYAYFTTIEKIINWRSSDYGQVWQSAYDVWLQSPFFGVGLHKYREACENLFTNGGHPPLGLICFHPHNISLQLLSETGIFGFILFYLMVIVLAFTSLKLYFTKRLWLSFALVFNILFTCFLPIAASTSFFANKYGAIVWLLVGVMLATNKLFRKNIS